MSPQSKNEWLAGRKRGIGGSDAPALLGYDPYRGPYSVYIDKTTAHIELTEEDSEAAPRESAHWGNMLEDPVAQEFEARTGLRAWKPTTTYVHPKYPWMLGSIDRLVGYDPKSEPEALLEIKTTSLRREKYWEDAVPMYPFTQVQHYLAITGLPMAWVACLIGGQRYVQYEVPRDESFIANLVEVEADMWRRIQEGDPPPMDASATTTSLIEASYPQTIPDQIVELDYSALDYLVSYVETEAQIKELEDRQRIVKNMLKRAMGEAEYATLAGMVVASWKTATRSNVDVRAMRRAHPEVTNDYSEVTTYRTFKVKLEPEAVETLRAIKGD